MEAQRFPHFILALLVVLGISTASIPFVFAEGETNVSAEVDALNDEIDEKKRGIEQINRQIKEYEKKISSKQTERASLNLEIELLENRVAQTELEIEEVNAEISLVNSELFLLEKEILALEDQLTREKKLIEGVLQEMQVQDHSLPLHVFFGTDSFSELFDQMDQLETVSNDLEEAIKTAKESRAVLDTKQDAQLIKRDQLDNLQISLVKKKNVLASSIGAQETLLSQTKKSEAEFQALLKELKQEQQFIDQQIAVLQSEIEGKLSASDEVGDSSILSWPFHPARGISATFHDPTYPFRHLFEHSGLDLPASTGTPVKAAAAGYVAWARKGRLYGNYVMIIHANGIATLYAHLSRIDVEPDEFVERGKVIGAVGSTGLSTGPHLHFEVRKNGIPTNPLNYLTGL